MTALLDNITSTMVSMAVLVMLVVMQQRMQETAVNRAITYTVKKQAIELGEWIQEDLANIGAGVDMGSVAIAARSENESGQTSFFSFQRKLDADDEAPSVVAYTLVPKDTVDLDGRSVQLYQVERKIDGAVTGRSMPTVTDFHIEMLDNAGRITDVKSQARQVRVRFSSALPYSGEKRRYLRQTHWKTIVPLRDLNL